MVEKKAMRRTGRRGPQEGLRVLRIILVLSSLAPLFLLWAIRGVALLPDLYFVPGCSFLAIVPTLILLVRERVARRDQDSRELEVGTAEDHRGHVLVYLFAILLPFYRQDVECWREFAALLVALVFIIYLFWHLNFHYMNVLFALRGYCVFTVHPPQQENQFANMDCWILITRRRSLAPGQRIVGLRLSNSVYVETSA